MIKAKSSKWFQNFFSIYLNFILKRDFHSIGNNEIEIEKNKSILVLANHISWWDGFLIFYINKKYFNKNFHVMMLEEHLKKNKFLGKLGAYSIQKKSRDIIESLTYTSQLLEVPKNLVLVFPEGEIHSQQQINFPAGNGTDKILSMCKNDVQVIGSIIFIDYGSNQKPSISIYQRTLSNQNSTKAFQDFYQECREKHINLTKQ